MELKKREEAVKKEYAKNDEISTRELKRFTPKKWVVASTIGITSLFYANPNSILGSIGVVFGCIEAPVSNYSIIWHGLNFVSNVFGYTSAVIGSMAIILAAIQYIDTAILSFKKDFDKEEHKKKNKKYIMFIKVLAVVAVIAFLIHFIFDEYILEMEIPAFFEGGVKQYDTLSPF